MENAPVRFSNRWKIAAALALMLGAALPAGAAVLVTETFGSGSSGWVDRDPVEMSVSYSAGFGNAAGSLRGTFAGQGVPSFESDAFRATPASSGGNFTGNLYLSYTNFTDFSFAFYAEDVLPSTFLFRVGNGVNTFLLNLNPQLSSLATWTTVNVSLAYSAGWLGGTAAQFSNVFNNVTFLDVQVGRNGTGAQDYFLDNFSLNETLNDLVMVPEPGSSGLLMLGSFALLIYRRRRQLKAML